MRDHSQLQPECRPLVVKLIVAATFPLILERLCGSWRKHRTIEGRATIVQYNSVEDAGHVWVEEPEDELYKKL